MKLSKLRADAAQSALVGTSPPPRIAVALVGEMVVVAGTPYTGGVPDGMQTNVARPRTGHIHERACSISAGLIRSGQSWLEPSGWSPWARRSER